MSGEMIDARNILTSGRKREGLRRVVVYDFKRPDKFSKEQLRTLEVLHETFARLSSLGLSTQLNLPVKVNVGAVDQMTFGEFTRSQPGLCPMGILRFAPLKGFMIIGMDPAVSSAAVDRLYGGTGRAGRRFRRFLSPAEDPLGKDTPVPRGVAGPGLEAPWFRRNRSGDSWRPTPISSRSYLPERW